MIASSKTVRKPVKSSNKIKLISCNHHMHVYTYTWGGGGNTHVLCPCHKGTNTMQHTVACTHAHMYCMYVYTLLLHAAPVEQVSQNPNNIAETEQPPLIGALVTQGIPRIALVGCIGKVNHSQFNM